MHPARGPQAVAGLVLALMLAIGGCAAATPSPSQPASESEGAPGDGPVLQIVARNLEFSPKRVQLPAGVVIHVVFQNEDAAPHNVTVTPLRSGVVAPVLHESEIVTGPAALEFDLEPLAPGPYLFSCSVHPSMQIEAEAV
jgi:plastocyanin